MSKTIAPHPRAYTGLRPPLRVFALGIVLTSLTACGGVLGEEEFQNDQIVSTAGDQDTKTANGVCFKTERTVSIDRFPRRVSPTNCETY